MMTSLNRALGAAKTAIMSGHPAKALDEIEKFSSLMHGRALTDADRAKLEASIAELRQLAAAAQAGTQAAIERVRSIVETARSLQTYDSGGKLHVSRTTTDSARRF